MVYHIGLSSTFDGASVNRRLVKLHDTSDVLLYKVRNIYSEDDRFIYFFSDPPHLIKTTQNCWASSCHNLKLVHTYPFTMYMYLYFQHLD